MKTTLGELRELVNDSWGTLSDNFELVTKNAATKEYEPFDIFTIQLKRPS